MTKEWEYDRICEAIQIIEEIGDDIERKVLPLLHRLRERLWKESTNVKHDADVYAYFA